MQNANQNQNQVPPGFYSEEQVSIFLGLKRATLRKYYSRDLRKIPPFSKKGKNYFFKIEDFNDWMSFPPTKKRGK